MIKPRSQKINFRPNLNPLENWKNDDLLLSEEGRRLIYNAWPRAYRVLDWLGLREIFEHHNALANSAKTKLSEHGGMGALFGAIGASLIAAAPLLPVRSLENMFVVLGGGLILMGGLMALWHLLGHSGRARWLLNRVWTERLRQFYFQFVVNNFDAAVAAMNDDAKLEAYQSLRNGSLGVFSDQMEKNLAARSFGEAILWLADDHEDTRVWAQSVWQVCQVEATRTTDDQRELLECLSRNRIGIQEIYARLNLKPVGYSQRSMAQKIAIKGNVATFLFVFSLTFAGIFILFSKSEQHFFADALISLSGTAAAWGLYFRLIDQGMGYSVNAERFELYFEQVGLVRQHFDATGDDVRGKIVALRQLEIYAYREMRQFLRTHLRSRFLG
jgi:hypothetical protein